MKQGVVRAVFVGAMAIAMAVGLSGPAFAGWSVVNLRPAATGHSYAYGVSGGQQVGYAYVGSNTRAGLWSGTAASWVDLNPLGAAWSEAYGVSGGKQVGYANVGGNNHAGLWSGTAGSWVDLNPAGSTSSFAMGVSGGRQVGVATVGGYGRAGLWTGAAGSWVDLHPAGAGYSYASGVSGGQQVGWAQIGVRNHASLWSGTAASWVDLNPAGSPYSHATGVSGGQQVGWAQIGSNHAGLWSGTAASWVDLNPAGAGYSEALGVTGNQQVGYAKIGIYDHAGLWSGTAASWVDLHAVLPGGVYSESEARSVDVSAGETWVAGYAYNTSLDRAEAMLWHYTPEVPGPEPPSTEGPANNLARNTTGSGYPSPLESEDGWGGATSKWDLVDGRRTYPGEWARGLAFQKGWHQVTIDFGSPRTFMGVTAWWHNGGLEGRGAPQAYRIESWNGTSWVETFSTTNPNAYLKYPEATPADWWYNWSAPTENVFSPITASKVRLWSYPKEGAYMDGYHTWLYEVEVAPVPELSSLVALGSGLAGLGRVAFRRRRR